ncbi:sialidase family protein [Arenibacter sp. S6351L]|uniref:sialidase family protein n=1 Tax=Arenibacter sp. S6351L TaxID=2926407 RepID=UPI001FF12DA3|nr:sialidase family protein [Arenibacter sp. S6351L]MCK0133865.1 glycoside hydrolase [Arenibacter sp. S6351L]
MKKTFTIIYLLMVTTLFGQNKNFQIADGVLNYLDLFNSSNNPNVSCYRIPALATAANGDLIAAIDERVPSCGDLKWSKDINIVIRRSSDNGKTWSEIEKIVDFPPGKSASDPSMIVDNITKEIFLFYNFMDLNNEKDVYYLHVIKSKDNGKTWSQPEDITPQITKEEWHNDFKFITSGRGIQTRSGALLHCMVNLNNGLRVFGSNDHGKTWFFRDTALFPADESKIVELADGSWMVNSRSNNTGIRHIHRSQDEGKSWKTIEEPFLIDPGCNASIIRFTAKADGYNKNRLLFSNAKSDKDRVNMTVRISYDEGKTWSEGKTIYEGDSAYSSMTIMDNGDIGLFFEKDDHTENAFVSFSLNWLTDGKDTYKKPNK